MNHILFKEETVFLFIDIQDSLASVMKDREDMEKNAKILAKTAKILECPAIFTTQYKKGLGEFNEKIRSVLDEPIDVDKKSFSCMLNEEFRKVLEELQPKSIVVCGIEAHICTLLTVRDLIKAGYEVYVAGDAIASRKKENKNFAIEEMRQMGAIIRSTESILFDLNSVAGTEEFKQIQKLIK